MLRLPKFVFAALGVLGLGSTAGWADDKGDALLRNVRTAASEMEPLVGEYEVISHAPRPAPAERYMQSLGFGATGWGGSERLPPEAFNLFDPVTLIPATTRYVGRQTLAGETFEVVELYQPHISYRLLIGSDGLIHRAYSLPRQAGKPSFNKSSSTKPLPRKPLLPPDIGRLPSVQRLEGRTSLPPMRTDRLEIVASYHKPRSLASLPDLPLANTRLKFLLADSGARRFPFRF